jgi:hypothetical protein
MAKFLPLALLFVSANVFSQAKIEKIFIKGDFYNKPLVSFIKEVESRHHIRFHYVNDVVEGVVINGIFKNKTMLTDALKTLLLDKPISFAVIQEGEIILYENKHKPPQPTQKLGTLSGIVTDKVTGQPLPYVTIHIPGAAKGAVSDEEGKFAIKPLRDGTHLVQFSFVGYKPLVKKIDINDDTMILIALDENSMVLKELVITPSMFEILSVEPSPLTLGKEEILHSPNMGKDIYRTMRALPGIANNDYSSKARIRGGHSDETAVYLDHFLINEAFHLEELDGSFSIFNTDYVDELTVLTGGFSAKHADRLSGIIDVKTHDHLEADKYRFSADLMNLSLMAQKKIGDKTNISFTARRGYLDFLLRKMNTEDDTDAVDPRFSDFWGKITHKANDKNSFSFNVLVGRDNFKVADQDEFSAQLDIKNIRDNINLWANWKWFPAGRVSSITTAGYQVLQKDGNFVFADNINFNNLDENTTGSLVFTNNTFWDVMKNNSIEMGFELRGYNSDYKYNELRYDGFNSTASDIIIHDVNIEAKFKAFTSAAYLQYNLTIKEDLILQPGLRVSSQSFSPDLKLAPRFAMSYTISPSFNAKLAYGIYYQPDFPFKLRTSLYQTEPYEKNGTSIHYTGSLNYSRSRTNVMLNLYHKEYDYLFDDYRFEFFNRMGGTSILDIPFNTNSGYSKGVEIMARQRYGKNSMLSVSYAYSKSIIRNADGEETFRDFDQPHTIIVNNTFRLIQDWNISLLWTYHTGYPYTPTTVDFIQYRANTEGIVLFYEAGYKNSKRLPSSHSLDIRFEKAWHFRKNVLSAYLNIVNFYGRENIRSYWWYPYRNGNGSINFEKETQIGIPFFVSPGISFTIY